jgi:hypothetical protein
MDDLLAKLRARNADMQHRDGDLSRELDELRKDTRPVPEVAAAGRLLPWKWITASTKAISQMNPYQAHRSSRFNQMIRSPIRLISLTSAVGAMMRCAVSSTHLTACARSSRVAPRQACLAASRLLV